MYRFWERLLDPYGAYRRALRGSELEPTFEDAEMLVVGVNTAFNWTVKDGRITRSGCAAWSSKRDSGESTPAPHRANP